MIKSKRFCAILGAATFATSLSLPVLAGSAKDDALEACRLHPGCSQSEIIAKCKGKTKCIIQQTNKRIKETPDRANKAIKKTKDAAIKSRDSINQTADKANKGIKNIFKKKKHHHHHHQIEINTKVL